MSDSNINNMDFKQLRNEVQMLRDELAIMQRKYEDILYNLDDENFSNRLVQEKGDMKAAIEVTAEEIKAMVTESELESAIRQNSQSIVLSVDRIFNSITKVTGKSQMTDTNKIYTYDGDNWYYDSLNEKWTKTQENSIGSVFVQTTDGFVLKGTVKILSKNSATQNTVEIDNGFINLKPNGQNSKLTVGFNQYSSSNDTYIVFGQGTSNSSVGQDGTPDTPGTGMILKDEYGFKLLFYGSDSKLHGMWFIDASPNSESFISFGSSILDFSSADVRGITPKFA